jgi:hypothetical protein
VARSARDSGPHACWRLASLLALAGLLAPAPALADGAAGPPAEGTLDGTYLAVGPAGAAIYLDGGWDAVFGGELSLARVQERRPLAGYGLTLGAAAYTERSGGRLWADLQAGTRWLGPTLGVGAGPVVEIDDLRPPRWGVQGSVWLYAGAIPYLRAGHLERTGTFIEFGLRIPLPALDI